VKILVTGATGFLGKEVVGRLTDAGHEVLAMGRRGPVVGDITDPESLPSMQGVDVVVHSAGMVSNDTDDAGLLFDLHVRGTENVLARAKADGVKRVVYISTSGTIAVSESAISLSEDAEAPRHLIQQWPYYRSKLYAEEVAVAADCDEMSVITLNPSLLLGPGDDKGESTKSVRMWLDDQVPMAPPGGISFVDVRDVAAAVESALTKGLGGRRYLLSGANITFLSFYERLAQITERQAPPRAPRVTKGIFSAFPSWGKKSIGFGFGVDRVGLLQACHYWYCDDGRARRELDFVSRDPGVTLRDTCADILWEGGSKFAPPERVGL
jgi:dihydroflavonol-4-reductase